MNEGSLVTEEKHIEGSRDRTFVVSGQCEWCGSGHWLWPSVRWVVISVPTRPDSWTTGGDAGSKPTRFIECPPGEEDDHPGEHPSSFRSTGTVPADPV